MKKQTSKKAQKSPKEISLLLGEHKLSAITDCRQNKSYKWFKI